MGLIMIETAKTNTIFIIFDPMIFPTTKLGSFFLIATTDVTSSGKLVPSATTDRDITMIGIPKKVAMPIAPEMKSSAPYPNIIAPIKTYNRYKYLNSILFSKELLWVSLAFLIWLVINKINRNNKSRPEKKLRKLSINRIIKTAVENNK